MSRPKRFPARRTPLPSRRLVAPGRPTHSRQGRSRILFYVIGIVALVLIGLLAFWLWQCRQPHAIASTPTPGSTQNTTPVSLEVGTEQAPGGTATSQLAGDVPTRAPSSTPDTGLVGFDVPALQELMLDLINRDRTVAGLERVQWDTIAANAGQAHAEDMADLGYMSHWNIDGYGPDHRYWQAGGLDVVFENVYLFQLRGSDGEGASISNWDNVVEEAQARLMNSEGHRANILAPEHTHVGIGIAYNRATGDVRIAQEFVNRYTELTPLPRRARLGDRLILRGRLLPGSTDPLINLAHEPFPVSLSLEQLKATSTYQSPAETTEVPSVNLYETGEFVAEILLDSAGQPGLYHVRLWVNHGALKVEAVDAVIEVR